MIYEHETDENDIMSTDQSVKTSVKNNWVGAVSYTHLDVYKRQVYVFYFCY